MRAFIYLLVCVCAAVPAFAGAQQDYLFAKKCYKNLNHERTGGWDRCLGFFERVIQKHPDSNEAKLALYSIARLLQEKFELSKNTQDLETSFKIYNQFLKKYPQDSMADDALFVIGMLRWDKQKDEASATRALQTVIDRYPKGDMVKAAQDWLKKIHGEAPVITAPKSEEKEDAPTTSRTEEGDFKVQTVVIDPGHGGEDPGAIGKKGLKEAEVALQIARKLAFELKNEYGLTVYLTRTNNKTLSLEERNYFANQKKADLFISIHANANPSPTLTGVQTFYLNNATSEAAKRLATRENKASQKPIGLSDQILQTMLQNANTEESKDLAQTVQRSLIGTLQKKYKSVRDNGVDTALFYVLVGAKCPSILVETSFITNPKEEKRLREAHYQWGLVKGIAGGIEQYVQLKSRQARSTL